jgi:hypothetical protein
MTRNQWRPGPKDNSQSRRDGDDWVPQGPGVGGQPRMDYRGYGPRGYVRSDRRIEEDINDRLTEHPDIDASEIGVRVEKGEVTLDGTVDRRGARRLAEDIVDQVSGVTYIQNNLRVRGQERQGPSHASETALAAASQASSRRTSIEDIGNANRGRGESGDVRDPGVATGGSTGRVTLP